MPSYKQVDYNSLFSPRVGDKNSVHKYPSWKKGISYSAGNLQIVELPLVYNYPVIVFPGSFQYAEEDKKRVAAASLQKLLLVKSMDGKIKIRTVTIIPAPEYAKKNNYDVSQNTIRSIDPSFTGWLVVKGWNEKVVNFWEIYKGKRVKKLKVIQASDAARQSTFTCYEDPYVESTSAFCVGNTCGDEPCENEGCNNWVISINIGTQLTCDYTEGEEDPWSDCMLSGSTEDCICEILGLCDGDDPCLLYGIDCDGGEQPLPEIINLVDDPCIKNSVNEAVNKGCKNEITTFINNVFANSEQFHLHFSDGIFTGVNADNDAMTSTGPTANLTETMTYIRFNNNQLGAASKEYIAATIMHEAVHAWINYKYPDPVTNSYQHSLMASTGRFNLMRDALMEMYPSISLADAIDLTWGGLYDTVEFNNLPVAERNRIIQKNLDYKNHTLGTPC